MPSAAVSQRLPARSCRARMAFGVAAVLLAYPAFAQDGDAKSLKGDGKERLVRTKHMVTIDGKAVADGKQLLQSATAVVAAQAQADLIAAGKLLPPAASADATTAAAVAAPAAS